jgi:hypothetical protein
LDNKTLSDDEKEVWGKHSEKETHCDFLRFLKVCLQECETEFNVDLPFDSVIRH